MPQALTIGVDYRLFWKLNPKTIEPFIESFKNKKHQQIDQINLQAWINGLYVMHAVAAVFSKNANYFDEPISFLDRSEDNKQSLDLKKFESFAILYNNEYEKNHNIGLTVSEKNDVH